MEIKPSTECSSNRSEEFAAGKKQQRENLLENVDVAKVNAMFQQSVEAFEGSDEESSSLVRRGDDDCRWDQWGRSGWPRS